LDKKREKAYNSRAEIAVIHGFSGNMPYPTSWHTGHSFLTFALSEKYWQAGKSEWQQKKTGFDTKQLCRTHKL